MAHERHSRSDVVAIGTAEGVSGAERAAGVSQ